MQRVEKIVCTTTEEKSVFRTLSSRIPEEPEKKNVLLLFEILTGEGPLSENTSWNE